MPHPFGSQLVEPNGLFTGAGSLNHEGEAVPTTPPAQLRFQPPPSYPDPHPATELMIYLMYVVDRRLSRLARAWAEDVVARYPGPGPLEAFLDEREDVRSEAVRMAAKDQLPLIAVCYRDEQGKMVTIRSDWADEENFAEFQQMFI